MATFAILAFPPLRAYKKVGYANNQVECDRSCIAVPAHLRASARRRTSLHPNPRRRDESDSPGLLPFCSARQMRVLSQEEKLEPNSPLV